jgi:uncharacterized protein (DUF305 family)
MKSLSPKLTFLALGFVLGIFTATFVYLGISFKNKTTLLNMADSSIHSTHNMADSSSMSYNDLDYLNMMIIHHTDALTMADEALRKSSNKFILTLSKNIITTQSEEIKDMKAEMENIVNNK